MNLQSLTKEEALNLLSSRPHLNIKDFKVILSTLKASNNRFKVDKIKVGDIFKITTLGCHPAVIISIKGGVCYALLLTTEKTTENILGSITSRYISGYITSTLITISISNVTDKIYTIYGNSRELSKYKKSFKEIVKTI